MRRHLPSITALRAFEAAAENKSFVKAAAQLHVTPAAISQQLRALEALLKVKLFQRVGRSVRLTEAGRRWLPEVRGCLDGIERAIERVEGHAGSALTITVAPSLASRWLVDRIHGFTEVQPDISVRMLATPEVIDLRSQEVDLAIRFGPGRYPGLVVERLLSEYLVPVCAPGLLARGPPLAAPADLRHHTLIHDESVSVPGGTWQLWLQAVGAPPVDAHAGPRFSLAELALQAAIRGRGVVLARWHLCVDDVRAERLVAPFAQYIDCPFAYYVVSTPELHDSPPVAAFREWLFAEAANVIPPAAARESRMRKPRYRPSRRTPG